MAEYIEREALRNALYEADAITMSGVKIINQFPAADVVEVVRCKDCEHFKPFVEPFNNAGNCRKSVGINLANHFCSYGERKDNEKN